MPYSKTPVISTYETKRLNFVINPLQRSASSPTKDAILSNMFVEILTTPDQANARVFVKSRPGLNVAYSHSPDWGRGVYYWKFNGLDFVITVVGNKVYSNDILVQTLVTTAGTVGFTEFVNDVGVTSLIMVDGTKGYVFSNPSVTPTEINDAALPVWTASTVMSLNDARRPTVANGKVYTVTTAGTTSGTQPTWPTTVGATITDGSVVWTCGLSNFPSPHIPQPVFLDGYLFLAKKDTQDIYNSTLADPFTWTAGDYISSELYPDTLVALSKNNNYIYAIGTDSVEYFFDEANPTASPLGRHDSAVQQFGCSAPDSVVQTEKEVILIGQTGNGGHTVWTIDGFKEKEIGTPAIRSALRLEGEAISQATAFCVRVGGQKFYVMNLTSKSFAYCFDTQMWFKWTSGVNGDTKFAAIRGTDGPNGVAYVQGELDGKVYLMGEQYYTDGGVPFLCEIITPKYDFEVFNQKTMSRLSVIGDIPTTSGTGNNMTVFWSDNDYQTWSNPRTLSFDYDFPSIAQLGRFRRRAFKFQYSQPYMLRLEGFEVDINKGNQ
jgi:hypothetical protein